MNNARVTRDCRGCGGHVYVELDGTVVPFERDLRAEVAALTYSQSKLSDAYAALTADNERLRATIKAVEWGLEPVIDKSGRQIGVTGKCPWCLAVPESGHYDDCAFCAALAPRETP